MPRPFSQQERATIEAALLEHGRRLFATQGLRKTAVEELTTAVGISKGGEVPVDIRKLLASYDASFQN